MMDLTLQGQHQQAVELVYAYELERAVEKCQRILRSFPNILELIVF